MKTYAFLFLALIIFTQWDKLRDEFSPPPDFSAQHPEGVVLYATSWCGYCKKTREFFNKNNIAFVEYDIESSAEGKAQYDQLRASGIPVVMIKGKLIRGYDPTQFAQLLDIPTH